MILYKNSPIKMLQSLFPEKNFLPWKFSTIPNFFWDKESNRKAYLNWLSNKLNIKDFSDWYNITNSVIEILFFS